MATINRRDVLRLGVAGTVAASTVALGLNRAMADPGAPSADAPDERVLADDKWTYNNREIWVRTVQVGNETTYNVSIDGINMHVMKHPELGGFITSMRHYQPMPTIKEAAERSVDATAGFALVNLGVAGHHHS